MNKAQFEETLPKNEDGTINTLLLTTPQKISLRKFEVLEKVASASDDAKLRHIEAQLASPTFIANEIKKQECNTLSADLDLLREQGVTIRGQYGIGEHNGYLASLATTIYFARVDVRDETIISRGLSILTLEKVVNSVGNAPYYHKETHSIVDARETDCVALADALKELSLELDLSGEIDTGKISQASIDKRNKEAMDRAVLTHKNTETLAKKSMTLNSIIDVDSDADTPTQDAVEEDEIPTQEYVVVNEEPTVQEVMQNIADEEVTQEDVVVIEGKKQ